MTPGDSSASPLVVTVARGDDVVIAVAGDVDYQGAGTLRDGIASAFDPPPATVTLDMAGLTFIDSTGLSLLVQAWRRGQDSGVPVVVRDAPPFLTSILDITGVAELFARPVSRAASGTASGTAAIA
jgi:anti-anti-sigma factor